MKLLGFSMSRKFMILRLGSWRKRRSTYSRKEKRKGMSEGGRKEERKVELRREWRKRGKEERVKDARSAQSGFLYLLPSDLPS